MITAVTYLKILCLWSTVFFHWLVKILFKAYAKKDKTEFFFYIGCILSGFLIAQIVVELLYWFDVYPVFASPENFPKTSNFSFEAALNDVTVQQQKEFEIQEETEDYQKKAYIWMITTVLVYCVVFTVFKP